ncbi:MAG TPA: hypothetical protein PLS50_09250, partial [Candidatus Dojkabacteria bacterium]|nr:hypothetical protein [Candidatus Dojkabacteria bacterium]
MYQFDQSVLDEYKQLESEQKNTIERLKNIYNTLPVMNYYTLSPKGIFARLTGDGIAKSDSRSIIYDDFIKEIESIILKKFRELLNNAKSMESSDYIRRFETGLRYLPDNLAMILKDELKHFREDLTRDLEYYNKELDDTLTSQNIPKIKSLMEKSIANKKNLGVQKIEEFVLKEMARLKSKIISILDTFETDGVISELNKLNEYRENFESDETKRFFEEVASMFIVKFSSAYNNFTKSFFSLQVSLVTNDGVILATEKNLSLVLKFFQINQDFKKFKGFEEFQALLLKKMKELNSSLFDYLSKYHNQCDSAFKDLDVSFLKKSQGFAKKCEGLI